MPNRALVLVAAAVLEAREKPSTYSSRRPGRHVPTIVDQVVSFTVEQIAEATGWQHHTIRGAISGALKNKLGLTVEATRTREVGPNKDGAKGNSTVYRIVEGG